MEKIIEQIKDFYEKKLIKYNDPKDELIDGFVRFNHILDNDNIIVQTDNVIHEYDENDNLVKYLVIGADLVIPLKSESVKYCTTLTDFAFVDGYLVKVNRNDFNNIIKDKIDTSDYCFNDEIDTFESLYKIAVLQNNNVIFDDSVAATWDKLIEQNFVTE